MPKIKPTGTRAIFSSFLHHQSPHKPLNIPSPKSLWNLSRVKLPTTLVWTTSATGFTTQSWSLPTDSQYGFQDELSKHLANDVSCCFKSSDGFIPPLGSSPHSLRTLTKPSRIWPLPTYSSGPESSLSTLTSFQFQDTELSLRKKRKTATTLAVIPSGQYCTLHPRPSPKSPFPLANSHLSLSPNTTGTSSGIPFLTSKLA